MPMECVASKACAFADVQCERDSGLWRRTADTACCPLNAMALRNQLFASSGLGSVDDPRRRCSKGSHSCLLASSANFAQGAHRATGWHSAAAVGAALPMLVGCG